MEPLKKAKYPGSENHLADPMRFHVKSIASRSWVSSLVFCNSATHQSWRSKKNDAEVKIDPLPWILHKLCPTIEDVDHKIMMCLLCLYFHWCWSQPHPPLGKVLIISLHKIHHFGWNLRVFDEKNAKKKKQRSTFFLTSAACCFLRSA